MQGSIHSRKWAYLAGLIDGDGTIVVGRQSRTNGYNYKPWVCVCSTEPKLVKWLVTVFGGQFYKLRTISDKHKIPYQWMAADVKHIETILTGVLPYLVMKKDRAENVLNYLSLGTLRSPEDREYYYKVSKELSSFNAPLNKEIPQFSNPTKDQYAYLAGLFDAEGSVSINKSHKRAVLYQLDLCLSNSDGRIMSWLLNTFGGTLGINYPANRLPAGRWRIPASHQEHMLLALLPYLITKRDRANIGLMWKRSKGCEMELKHEMYEKMRILNKFGNSLTTNTLGCPENGQKIESDLIGNYECAPLETVVA